MHAHPASCAIALFLASISSSRAFLTTPLLTAAVCRHHHQQAACGPLAMTVETPSSSASSSTSRKAFLRRGATAIATSCGLVAAVASPAASLAKDIGGIDVRGIDVAEMLHPGAGGGSGKASKPLRDCLLNLERVRMSTKQVRTALQLTTAWFLFLSTAAVSRTSQLLPVLGVQLLSVSVYASCIQQYK